MGVMACDRVGCDNIMCRRMMTVTIDRKVMQFYICSDCWHELRSAGRTWAGILTAAGVHHAIGSFMSTPAVIQTAEEQIAIDAEIERVTERV